MSEPIEELYDNEDMTFESYNPLVIKVLVKRINQLVKRVNELETKYESNQHPHPLEHTYTGVGEDWCSHADGNPYTELPCNDKSCPNFGRAY